MVRFGRAEARPYDIRFNLVKGIPEAPTPQGARGFSEPF
jgi:hypothetical protein